METRKNQHLKDVKGQSEDALQQKCYIWFHNTYPNHRGLLFSVPNGMHTSKVQAVKMRRTGMVSGVSDLLLMLDGKTYCIELKIQGGRQSQTQKNWQEKVTTQGFEYVVLWSFKEFKEYVSNKF